MMRQHKAGRSGPWPAPMRRMAVVLAFMMMVTFGAFMRFGMMTFGEAVKRPAFWVAYAIAPVAFCLAGYLLGPRADRKETLGLPISLPYFCLLTVMSLAMLGWPVIAWAVTQVGLGWRLWHSVGHAPVHIFAPGLPGLMLASALWRERRSALKIADEDAERM